jgi:Fungal protein kinase
MSFKSKKEFITVMISLIQSKLSSLHCASNEAYSNSIAHQYLVEKLGILHCDISINNLLINLTDAIICGLLIDFDFAILLLAGNAPVVQTSTSTLGDIAAGMMHEASGTNSNVGDVKRIVDVSNDEDDQGFKTINSKVKNVRTVCSFISKSMNQRVNYKSGHTIHGS